MVIAVTKFLFSFFVISLLVLNISLPVYSEGYDTAAGGDSTDTSGGSGNQQSFDGSNDKSAANSEDFSGNNDFSGNSNNNDSFSDYSDFSSNDSNNDSFSDLVDATFGLGNEAGVESNPGGPAPLSNQNDTIDSAGATASMESTDEGYQCTNTNCNSPTLTGYTYCLANQPVVRLDWTMDATNVNYWHVVKAKEPSPQFTQLTSQPVSHQFYFVDNDLLPNDVYYYGVFGSNSGNGAGYSSRTPLSNIFAVYTPSCAPVVTSSCPVVGVVENFNLTWNNNDPAATGYKLYRGNNGNVSTRAFLPPNHPASTNSYTDNSVILGVPYNYWLKSYVTVYHAAYSEVTSTDENGNPTGYADYPAYYEDVESPFSGMSESKSPVVCAAPVVINPSPSSVSQPSASPAPPVRPTVNLYLNERPSNDLPLVVNQNAPVTIRWSVTDATTCTASSNPGQSYWTGNQNPSAGSQSVDTTIDGDYQFTLDCTNGVLNTSVTAQLKVSQSSVPYIRTTDGDVHSNKNISVPEQ